jgi:hypothetical protein
MQVKVFRAALRAEANSLDSCRGPGLLLAVEDQKKRLDGRDIGQDIGLAIDGRLSSGGPLIVVSQRMAELRLVSRSK